MAPRARVAAYKACWPDGCATTDLVAAIDTAVADGVDVINYSIGDRDPDFLDADDVAFLFARQAGVFVAASAGNSGPGASTVDHGGPWLTTVGASTQNRSFTGTVTLGNGQTFKGVTLTYQGTFGVAAQGLVAATTETRTVADDPTNNFDTDAPDSNQGIQVHSFTVPTGTTIARFQLFDEFTDGNDDIDLYLYRVGTGGALTLVGFSAGGTSAERIDLQTPAAGTYRLYAHGWQTDGTSAVYTLFNWLVPGTAAGNMTVASSTSSATVGGTADVTVSWSGLTAGTKYLGRVSYSDGSSEIGSTIVNANP